MKVSLINRSIRFLMVPVVLFSVWVVPICYGAEKTRKVIEVGSRKQLFIDEMFIESSRGVHLTMNPPYQTREMVLTVDQPWESDERACIGPQNTIMKEGERIRLWYDFIDSKNRCMGYAESTDGIHFTKPLFNFVTVNGYTKNNILLEKSRGGTVWIDPKAPSQHRYRHQCKEKAGKFSFFSSPDGICWKPTHSIDIGYGDTQSIVFWDEAIKRYVFYGRKKTYYKSKERIKKRMVRRLESDDLVSWDSEMTVMQADEIDNATYSTPTVQPPMDYYCGIVFKYPDPEGIYIMLPLTFWHWYDRTPAKYLGPQTYDARLATSRDGKNFKFQGNRKSFLRLGPEGSFYSRMLWVIPNPIRMGDELWIYYEGRNKDHGGVIDPASGGKYRTGIGRAIMRLDGFVSADADCTGGEIVTPLIRFEGNTLELNLDTSSGGSLRVELLDENDQPIEGYTQAEASFLCGNSVRMPVTWGQKQQVSKLAGKPVKLRFIMRDCKLYAFQFVK